MNYAYVTVLSTNDYYKGVIVLFESLKQTNPKYNNFVVLVNENIDKEIINDFNNRGYKVINKSRIDASFINNKSYQHWANTFDKFNIFDLTEFDKIIYLDSDMYINKNIDDLFNYPHMSAVAAGKSRYSDWININSGLMVIEPKEGISKELKELLLNQNFNKSIGDQDIIEEYFDWHNQNLYISENYNLFNSLVDYYINNLNFELSNICVIHYIGYPKIWMLSEDNLLKRREELQGNNKENELYFFDKYIDILKNIN